MAGRESDEEIGEIVPDSRSPLWKNQHSGVRGAEGRGMAQGDGEIQCEVIRPGLLGGDVLQDSVYLCSNFVSVDQNHKKINILCWAFPNNIKKTLDIAFFDRFHNALLWW